MEKDANAIKNSVFALKKSFEIFMNDNLKPLKFYQLKQNFYLFYMKIKNCDNQPYLNLPSAIKVIHIV